MSDGNLEPGQDDLVKEDKIFTSFRRVWMGAKNAGPGRSGTDERIYSDPDFTSDPDAVVQRKPPKLRKDRQAPARPASAPEPVESADPPKKKGRFSSLKEMWSEALAEAEAKQRAKRNKGS